MGEALSARRAVQAKRKQMFQRSASFVSSNRLLPLKHSFQFDAQRGVFCLALEATVPIFCVAVVATVHAEFLELQGSVAILTVSDPSPNSTARCLATYRRAPPVLHASVHCWAIALNGWGKHLEN